MYDFLLFGTYFGTIGGATRVILVSNINKQSCPSGCFLREEFINLRTIRLAMVLEEAGPGDNYSYTSANFDPGSFQVEAIAKDIYSVVSPGYEKVSQACYYIWLAGC
jgi:hypothetical protein